MESAQAPQLNNRYDPLNSCKNCFFYRLDPKNLKQGTCRFDPPAAFPIQNGNQLVAMSFVPNVGEDHWCGKWQPKVWQ
jgi:hypothetical protein